MARLPVFVLLMESVDALFCLFTGERGDPLGELPSDTLMSDDNDMLERSPSPYMLMRGCLGFHFVSPESYGCSTASLKEAVQPITYKAKFADVRVPGEPGQGIFICQRNRWLGGISGRKS